MGIDWQLIQYFFNRFIGVYRDAVSASDYGFYWWRLQ